MRPFVAAGVVAVVAITLSACGSGDEESPVTEAAYDICDDDVVSRLDRLGDEGESIIIDSAGERDMDVVLCLLRELDALSTPG